MKSDQAANYGRIVSKSEVFFVRNLPAPIDLVWEYLTDSEKRATWFAGGEMQRFVGGNLELHFKHANLSDADDDQPPAAYAEVAGEGVKMQTVITGYEPPRLLSYLWKEGEEPGVDSEVTFELEPLDDDHTRLTLTHRKLAGAGSVANVGTGWHLHLAFLEAKLTGGKRPLLWKTHGLLQNEYASELGIDLSEVKSCH